MIRTVILILLIVSIRQAAADELIVCLECSEKHVNTIEQAIRQAAPGDTIKVIFEPAFPIILEHVVIDKPVRLVSEYPGQSIELFNYHPVITHTSGNNTEIMKITVPGVEVEGFNFDVLSGWNEHDRDDADFKRRIGILLEAPASIRHCKFNRLRTAIYIHYLPGDFRTGSLIEHCQIGEPASVTWINGFQSQLNNFYGIVLLPAGEKQQPFKDTVKNTKIIGNRFYGIVFTPFNRPEMTGSIIEMNGDRPFRMAQPDSAETGIFNWVRD